MAKLMLDFSPCYYYVNDVLELLDRGRQRHAEANRACAGSPEDPRSSLGTVRCLEHWMVRG